MNESQFDCAIVGGGLAGLCLAIQLADKGREVILLEKEEYPFHKVCGEYISNESYSFLERIGLPLTTMNLPDITEVKISSPNGKSLTRKLDTGGFGISRYTLDALLFELAKKKGVVVWQNAQVNEVVSDGDSFVLRTGRKEYRAKIVCGAYGKRSLLDRKAGRHLPGAIPGALNYLAVKYHVKLDFPPNRIELHNFKGGYCGISKVDGDKCCLCYLTNAEILRENGNTIKLMEQNVLMQNPHLKAYFSEAVFLNERPLTISQITFGKKSPVEQGMLMIGDSAGTVTPLCGNGMSMAMRASFIASNLIDGYLDGRITFAQLTFLYKKEWHNSFSSRIRTGSLIQPLFGKKILTNMAIGLFRAIPWAADKVISATHGQPF